MFNNELWFNPAEDTSARVLFWMGARASGASDRTPDIISYIESATTGNPSDFGDGYDAFRVNGLGNATRHMAGGGDTNLSYGQTDQIEYVNPTSLGNSVDFGNLTEALIDVVGTSNDTRGIWAGGSKDGSASYASRNVIQYLTIASTGDCSDFGDLNKTTNMSGGGASTTRSICAINGSSASVSYQNFADYVTIASTGDASDFGDMSVGSTACKSSASSTRLCHWIAYTGSYVDTIDYLTIASTGDASDFGDSTRAGCYGTYGSGSKVRGIQAGGQNSGGYIDVIEYVTIASTGDASDFGDLESAKQSGASTSTNHGGL